MADSSFGVEAAMRRIESGVIAEKDARLVVARLRDCRSRTAQWCNAAAKGTLTDEERVAIAYYIGTGGPDVVDATLRSLLERLA